MHLRKLPSGSWRWIVQVNGQREAGTASTKALAKAAAAEKEVELGRAPKGATVTLAELLEVHLQEQGYSPRALKDLQSILARLDSVEPQVQRWRLRDVEPVKIDALYRRLKGKGWPPNTVKRLHMVLSSACARAVDYGWIVLNPFHTRAPHVPRRNINPPTSDEVKKIRAMIGGRVVLFMRLAAITGARRGELLGLTWDHIDGNTVRIRRGIDWVDGAWFWTEGKTEELGHRDVPIDPATVAQLEQLHAAQVAAAADHGLPAPQFVFSDDSGLSPWRGDSVSRAFRKARDRAGCPNVRLHDLRHHVATTLIAQGEDIASVANRLGHATPRTTTTTYTHYIPKKDDTATARLVAALDD